MIENFLKNVFPKEFGKDSEIIEIPIERKNVPFAIGDKKSCLVCHTIPSRANRIGCNEEVLKVNNNGVDIAIVHLEQYMKQFAGTTAGKKECCDYLLADSGEEHNKIVFCELCCYKEKYVEAKQAKARQQMKIAMETLMEELLMKNFLLTYPEKIHLFAWRDYSVPDKPIAPSRRNARANMLAFGSTVSNMALQTISYDEENGHGFKLIKIKYPSYYHW